MNPNYVHTITLYRKQSDGSFTRTVHHDCFWKAGISVTQSGTNASQSNIYTVRIPADEFPDGLTVSTGNDFVVYGECTDEVANTSGNRAAEILTRNKPNAFKVTAFSDNTSHQIDRHFRLGG